MHISPRIKNLRGNKFGRLTVLQYAGKNKYLTAYWKCHCACGVIKTIRGSSLTAGLIKSCGCYHRECAKRQGHKNKQHGDTVNYQPTVEHSTWRRMLARCYNPKNKSFKDYGRRGIRVCRRWKSSFENFLKDMGRRPASCHSIDRINNNGNYTPENCQWATSKQQNNNKRNVHKHLALRINKP